jgi:cytochrome c oxidase subunit 2
MTTPAGGGSKPSGSIIVAIFLIVLLGILVVGGSLTALQLPDPVTSQAKDIHTLYQATLVISMIIYFGVTAGIIWAIFRFRKTGPELPQQIHGSSTLEVGWTVIPIVILVGLFIPSFVLMLDLKTPPSEDDTDLTVEAIAHQWWWEFVYCQGGDCTRTDTVRIQRTPPDYEDLVPPRLVVPLDANVVAKVRSTDVVHSFYAPNFLYKIQAIPGNVNTMHFRVEKEGAYTGQCYQFCGLRHSDMLFVIEALPQDEFDDWLAEQRRAQGLDTTQDQATGAGED